MDTADWSVLINKDVVIIRRANEGGEPQVISASIETGLVLIDVGKMQVTQPIEVKVIAG